MCVAGARQPAREWRASPGPSAATKTAPHVHTVRLIGNAARGRRAGRAVRWPGSRSRSFPARSGSVHAPSCQRRTGRRPPSARPSGRPRGRGGLACALVRASARSRRGGTWWSCAGCGRRVSRSPCARSAQGQARAVLYWMPRRLRTGRDARRETRSRQRRSPGDAKGLPARNIPYGVAPPLPPPIQFRNCRFAGLRPKAAAPQAGGRHQKR